MNRSEIRLTIAKTRPLLFTLINFSPAKRTILSNVLAPSLSLFRFPLPLPMTEERGTLSLAEQIITTGLAGGRCLLQFSCAPSTPIFVVSIPQIPHRQRRRISFRHRSLRAIGHLMSFTKYTLYLHFLMKKIKASTKFIYLFFLVIFSINHYRNIFIYFNL